MQSIRGFLASAIAAIDPSSEFSVCGQLDAVHGKVRGVLHKFSAACVEASDRCDEVKAGVEARAGAVKQDTP